MENLAIGKYDVPVRQLAMAVGAGLALGIGALVILPPQKAGPPAGPGDPNAANASKKEEPTKPEVTPTKPEAPQVLGKTYALARGAHPTQLLKKEPLDASAKTPAPPAATTSKVDYTSEDGLTLGLWVPKTKAGAKAKPGVLLLPEGFEFKPELANDAGKTLTDPFFVTMPLLRGQAGMPGHFSLLFDEAADVQAAAQKLKKLPGAKNQPCFVVGHKEGGTLALLAALLDGGTTIDGVVVVGGHTEPKDSLKADHAPLLRFDTGDTVEWRMRTPLEFAATLKVPVLLVHREGDGELKEEYDRFKKAAGPAGDKVTIKKSFADSVTAAAPTIAKYLDELTKAAEGSGS